METLELICDTFGPQAAAKQINITFEVCHVLRSPDELRDSDSHNDSNGSINQQKLPKLIGD